MIFHRLQNRLIFLFILLAAILLFISGWTLQWMIRRNLEAELGQKLMAVAGGASVVYDETELSAIQIAGPRTRQRLLEKLIRYRDASGVARIYFFDRKGNSLLDTDPSNRPGTGYFNLRFYANELQSIQNRLPVNSILFRDEDNNPMMTGFAPVILDDTLIAGVGVDGNANFLSAVKRVQHRLYTIGIISICLAALLGYIMSRSITRPIAKLVAATRGIEQGHYDVPITRGGKDEIGHLSETMEEMRLAVVKREQELKAMLAGVAHEIRNPLGGIELFTGLLSDEIRGNRKGEEQIGHITRELSNLKETVNSFLVYARPQNLKPEIFRLKGCVEETEKLIHTQLEKQKVALTVDTVGENSVYADPLHVKRILLNLLHNSLAAMPDGGTISIEIRSNHSTTGMIIKDTGSGIPKDIQDKVFTPFFTTREKGTGLGLSIVKELVESNAGTITLNHSDKNGTEFEVHFPNNPENQI